MIDDVKELRRESDPELFGGHCLLLKSDVPFHLTGTVERMARRVAKVIVGNADGPPAAGTKQVVLKN